MEIKDTWAEAQLYYVIAARLQQFNSVKEVILDICSKETKDVARRVAVMIWIIWNNRNNWLWNQEKSGTTQMAMQAIQVWKDWYLANGYGDRVANHIYLYKQDTWYFTCIPSSKKLTHHSFMDNSCLFTTYLFCLICEQSITCSVIILSNLNFKICE
jgi:hypothetical protein